MLQKEVIVPQTLHKIPRGELYVVEFCKIENMRFRQNGGRHVQRVTNLRQIVEKVGIGEFFFVFIDELFLNMPVRH